MMHQFRVPLAALILGAACAGGGGSTSATPGGSSAAMLGTPTPRRSQDFISQEEIAQRTFTNAREIIESLRPNMLRIRGGSLTNEASSTGMSSNTATKIEPVLFVDDLRVGDLSRLTSIPATTVKEIRYISASDATTRWGTGYMGGVVLVTTKR